MRFRFSSNEGVNFIIKFVLLFLVFNYGNKAFIGLTAPGGDGYVPFLDQHLDYITWFRTSILYLAHGITEIFGFDSYIRGSYHLISSTTGRSVQMVYSCLGLGIMSFWAAFVLAHNGSAKKKLWWLFGGLIFIWVLNSTRVAMILMAVVNRWNINRFADHHDTFNVVAYIFVFILIYFFIRKPASKETTAAAA